MGYHSRMFQEPKGADGRQRDGFPLPLLMLPEGPGRRLSRAVERGVRTKFHIIKRVNMAISALNMLFFGGEGRFPSSRVAYGSASSCTV